MENKKQTMMNLIAQLIEAGHTLNIVPDGLALRLGDNDKPFDSNDYPRLHLILYPAFVEDGVVVPSTVFFPFDWNNRDPKMTQEELEYFGEEFPQPEDLLTSPEGPIVPAPVVEV